MEPRKHPVVWTPDTHPLLHAYEKRGYQIERNFFSRGQIAIAHCEALILADTYKGKQATLEANGTDVRLISGVHFLAPNLVKLLVTPKMIRTAEEILGDGIYIHQFRLHYKPAFWGGDFFWHSDFAIWHWQDGMMDPRCVHFMVPLEDMRIENGPLLVSPGTHMFNDESLWDKEKQEGRSIRQERDNPARLKNGFVTQEQLGLIEHHGVDTITGNMGDVFFCDVNLMHASGANFSPWGRMSASIVFNSLDNKLQDPPNGKPARANWISSREYNKL